MVESVPTNDGIVHNDHALSTKVLYQGIKFEAYSTLPLKLVRLDSVGK